MTRPGDERLDARIKSYELAAKMQLAAPEALDLSKETASTLKLYGLDHGKGTFDKEINPIEETDYFGRKCLVARRLLERGVRFVQIWSGNDNGFPRRNWDSHEDVKRDHGRRIRAAPNRSAALIVGEVAGWRFPAPAGAVLERGAPAQNGTSSLSSSGSEWTGSGGRPASKPTLTLWAGMDLLDRPVVQSLQRLLVELPRLK